MFAPLTTPSIRRLRSTHPADPLRPSMSSGADIHNARKRTLAGADPGVRDCTEEKGFHYLFKPVMPPSCARS